MVRQEEVADAAYPSPYLPEFRAEAVRYFDQAPDGGRSAVVHGIAIGLNTHEWRNAAGGHCTPEGSHYP